MFSVLEGVDTVLATEDSFPAGFNANGYATGFRVGETLAPVSDLILNAGPQICHENGRFFQNVRQSKKFPGRDVGKFEKVPPAGAGRLIFFFGDARGHWVMIRVRPVTLGFLSQ